MKRNDLSPIAYYTEEDFSDIENSNNFSELCSVALRILSRMPQPIAQVCGPIGTGGRGNIEENLKEFERVIDDLSARGEIVFTQIPFEDPMQRMKMLPEYEGGMQILEEFYLPLFESGFIKKLYFIPLWNTSMGASWEHEQAKRLGIEIRYI
jgi:hypothetical protein